MDFGYNSETEEEIFSHYENLQRMEITLLELTPPNLEYSPIDIIGWFEFRRQTLERHGWSEDHMRELHIIEDLLYKMCWIENGNWMFPHAAKLA